MALVELNIRFFKSVPGILKLSECVLVFILLMVARFGNDGNHVAWGNEDKQFLGIGSCVGYMIIVSTLILSYVLGATTTIFEFIANLVGSLLFISLGAAMVASKGKSDLQSAVGGLAIVLGILLLADFVYLCVKHRDNLR